MKAISMPPRNRKPVCISTPLGDFKVPSDDPIELIEDAEKRLEAAMSMKELRVAAEEAYLAITSSVRAWYGAPLRDRDLRIQIDWMVKRWDQSLPVRFNRLEQFFHEDCFRKASSKRNRPLRADETKQLKYAMASRIGEAKALVEQIGAMEGPQ